MQQLCILLAIVGILFLVAVILREPLRGWLRRLRAESAAADRRGDPLVTTGCPGEERHWPRVVSPAVDTSHESHRSQAVEEDRTQGTNRTDELQKKQPGASAAALLKDKFGGANVGAWVDRAAAGELEVSDLLLMEAVCRRGRIATMRRAARGGLSTAPEFRADRVGEKKP